MTLRLRAATETDATLRALTVTHPGGSVRLRPAFASQTEEYAASVANAVDEVTVAARATVAGARLEYLGGDDNALPDADTGTADHQVALSVGANIVKVKVTAEDTTTTKTYTVTVTRREAEALGEEGEWRLTETRPYADPDNDRYGGTMGRVGVFHAGAWGTVCSDGIRKSEFELADHDDNYDPITVTDANGNEVQTFKTYNNEAAALICKDRGYDDGEYDGKYKYRPGELPNYQDGNVYWPASRPYSGAATPIWIDDLTCVPDGTALTGSGALPGAMSHCGYAGWGLHNCTHKEDAVVRCWNNDPAGPGIRALQGRFVSAPERHDGTNRIRLRVAFSEPVEESPQDVGAHGVEVEGGAVTSVSPVGGDAPDGAETRSIGNRNAGRQDREVVWEFEIEPGLGRRRDGDLRPARSRRLGGEAQAALHRGGDRGAGAGRRAGAGRGVSRFPSWRQRGPASSRRAAAGRPPAPARWNPGAGDPRAGDTGAGHRDLRIPGRQPAVLEQFPATRLRHRVTKPTISRLRRGWARRIGRAASFPKD